MKKKILLVFVACLILLGTVIYAADQGYAFDLKYSGDVIENVAKKGSVTLTGTEATAYPKVRIKVDLVSGPATPEILATDSAGTTYNLAQIGYWGPESGFAVGGTFTNETPITATYPKAGTYVTKLSLLDLNNDNAVITSKEFTVTVQSAEQPTQPEQPAETNNVIETIPTAGRSVWTYMIWVAIIALAIYGAWYFMKNKKS